MHTGILYLSLAAKYGNKLVSKSNSLSILIFFSVRKCDSVVFYFNQFPIVLLSDSCIFITKHDSIMNFGRVKWCNLIKVRWQLANNIQLIWQKSDQIPRINNFSTIISFNKKFPERSK